MPGLQRLLLHEPSASDSASGRSQPIHVVPDPAEPPLRPATESHSAPGFEYAPNETINQVGGWLKWEPETLRAFREQAKQLIEQMPQEVAKQLARTAVGFVPVVRVVVAAYETAEQVAGVAGRAFEGKTTKEDNVTITVWAFTILAAMTGGRGPRPQGGGSPKRGPVQSRHFSESPDGIRLHEDAQRFRSSHPDGKNPHRNISTADVIIDGERRTVTFINDPGAMHSEQKLVAWEDAMRERGRCVQVERVYTERPPCGPMSANCSDTLGNRYGADLEVYHSRPPGGRRR